MKAMIFAAGLGTRLKSLTIHKPKALVEVGGIPMLERVITKLINEGIYDFVINVHHFADLIEEYLIKHNYFNVNIQISDERDLLLDTGGGLLHAKDFLTDSNHILIHNVDILTDVNIKELSETHIKSGALATLSVHKRNASRKLIFDKDHTLCMWKNIQTNEVKTAKPCLSEGKEFAFTGIHILRPDIFDLITETGKFSIIDMYLRLASTQNICSFEVEPKYWFDLGKEENIIEAEKKLIF